MCTTFLCLVKHQQQHDPLMKVMVWHHNLAIRYKKLNSSRPWTSCHACTIKIISHIKDTSYEDAEKHGIFVEWEGPGLWKTLESEDRRYTTLTCTHALHACGQLASYPGRREEEKYFSPSLRPGYEASGHQEALISGRSNASDYYYVIATRGFLGTCNIL